MSSKFLDKTGLDTLWAKIKSTFQTLGNLVTAWGSTPSDTKYPSEKLVKDSLDGKANVADAELSTTSTNPLQNKEITRWHNIIIGDDGFVSGSAANPQLSLQKLKLGALSHYNKGVNIKIYTYDEGDEENASLVFDIANASDSVKDNFYNGFSMDTLFQSEAGKYVKIVYTGSTSCYFRALGVFMDTKDTSSTVSNFYGHLRVSNVDYPESGQFSTWGSLVVAAFSKTSATVAELILRPKTSASKCRIFGFRCLNTYTGSDWAVLIGRATSALKLTNSRKLCVDLSRTADSTFDGSADQTNIPVKNTLPVARGGTGKTSVTAGNYLVGNGTSALQEHTPNAAANNMLSALPDWTANPTDGVKLIRRDTGGSAAFGQVTFLTVWNYIKDKISSVLGLTATDYGGNAATATTAAGYTSDGAIAAALQGKQNSITDLATIRSGASAGASAVQPGDLGTAAYKDVPTIGDASTTQVVMGGDSRLTRSVWSGGGTAVCGYKICTTSQIAGKSGQKSNIYAIVMGSMCLTNKYAAQPQGSDSSGVDGALAMGSFMIWCEGKPGGSITARARLFSSDAALNNADIALCKKYVNGAVEWFVGFGPWDSSKAVTASRPFGMSVCFDYARNVNIPETLEAVPSGYGYEDYYLLWKHPYLQGTQQGAGATTRPVYVTANGEIKACTYAISTSTTGTDTNTIYLV